MEFQAIRQERVWLEERVWLTNARIPLAMLSHADRSAALMPDREGLVLCDMLIEHGRIACLLPADATFVQRQPGCDLAGRLVFPRFVDAHTHLDKGFIWPRAANPDGTFLGALNSVAADREAHWTRDDVERRMEFGLACAYAHGTGAIRTHLDSIGKQTAISWPLFGEIRARWKGRVALQAVSLFPIDMVDMAADEFRLAVEMTARHGGVLGGVTYLGQAPDELLDKRLDTIFSAAKAHGLDLDFHVDESADPQARSLERIADAALRHRFAGKIMAGHCCSLALMAPNDMARIIDKLGEAGISIVSLPLCNMYLQDRQAGRTPRWRGVAPLHELKQAGIPVMVASDNTRDPFYAYGDLDMLDVWREATRILQLDHAGFDWPACVATIPAKALGLSEIGAIASRQPADLVIVSTRSLNETMARPGLERMVLVAGQPIEARPPDYALLQL
jgi:cytosine/creatinine deaminase